MEPQEHSPSKNFGSKGKRRKRKSFVAPVVEIPPLVFPGDPIQDPSSDGASPADPIADDSRTSDPPSASGASSDPGVSKAAEAFSSLYAQWLHKLSDDIRNLGGWAPPPDVIEILKVLAGQAARAYLPGGMVPDWAAAAVTIGTPLAAIAYKRKLQEHIPAPITAEAPRESVVENHASTEAPPPPRNGPMIHGIKRREVIF